MIQIIPAIDIIDGKCVRLTRGEFSTVKVYNEDPLEVAKQFQDAGLKRLHLVDLDGARSGSVKNWKTLQVIAENTTLAIDFSGGISTIQAVSSAFNYGAMMVSVGSSAVEIKEEFLKWLMFYGPNKFILSADVNNSTVMVKGWTETSGRDIFTLIDDYAAYELRNVCCTDIAKDGMLQGPSFALYKEILKKFPKTNVIASGGVTTTKDIDTLNAIGCRGVIIGKAIYENRIKLEDLEQYVG